MIRGVIAVVVAALLVGCVGLARHSPDLTDSSTASPALLASWQQHRQSVLPLNHWKLRAKVGLRAGQRGEAASLIWQRNDADHTIEVFGPLGGGRMRMTLNPAGARITDSKKRSRSAASATELFEQVVGWRVPFDELGFWVKGLPAPGRVDAHQFLPSGQLANLTQNGWRVAFSDYRQWGGVLLPERLRVESLPGSVQIVDDKGEVADQLIVKVVAKEWTLQ